MLHPDIYTMFRRIRAHGMMAGLISNGYYLTRERIEKLNEAGLEYLQISIDNVHPDEVSQKSLKVLDRRLVDLQRYARFAVSINSVIGGASANRKMPSRWPNGPRRWDLPFPAELSTTTAARSNPCPKLNCVRTRKSNGLGKPATP
nr:hypothetical protein [Chloracidobacterium thermophilum]